MAELEARFTKDEKNWRRPLPEGTPVRLGRHPDRCDWAVEWDVYVSGHHANLLYKGGRLQVSVRTVPEPPRNPIFYRQTAYTGKPPLASFEMVPGETFRIGDTEFRLVGDPAAELTCSRDELTTFKVDQDITKRINALARLPEVIRQTQASGDREPTEKELIDRVLEVLLEGIPYARSAAVVRLMEGSTEKAPRVATLYDRDRAGTPGVVVPSRRLVWKAVAVERKSVGHIFGADNSSFTQGPGYSQNFSMYSSETEWILCAPLPDEPYSNHALYVEGALNSPVVSAADSPEMQGDLKFTALTAEIFGSLRQVLYLRQREAQFQQFFSPAVIKALRVAPDPDKVLQNRETPVTVLFCDLRGASGFMDEMANDLMQSWNHIRGALSVMTDYIFEYNGVIGDFQGDAALGFWGWPIDDGRQVESALRAALAIRGKFYRNNQDPAHPLSRLKCGIGVAHGRAIAGRIGADNIFKAGVFGPVVNRASRLETLTKTLGVSVLVDGEVTAGLGREADSWFRVRRIAPIQPYNMKTTTWISKVQSPEIPLPPDQERAWADFGEAYPAYAAGDLPRVRQLLGRYADEACGPSVAKWLGEYADRHGPKFFPEYDAAYARFAAGDWPTARRLTEPYKDRTDPQASAYKRLFDFMDRLSGKTFQPPAPDMWRGVVLMDHK